MVLCLADLMPREARTIISDPRRRLRGKVAVTLGGDECDPCGDEAARFCAIGALIRAAHLFIGNRQFAHELGWRLAGEVAIAAGLPAIDEDEMGWGLALLSIEGAKRQR